MPAVHANDNDGRWQSDFRSLVSTCLARPGTSGDIARLLAPQADDLTVLEPRHSDLYASPLELLLKEMQARALVICGLAPDICVQLTAADAFRREFAVSVWVPADCSAAESSQAQAGALDDMRDVLHCDIRPSVPPGTAA